MPFFGWAAMGTDPLAVKQSEMKPISCRIGSIAYTLQKSTNQGPKCLPHKATTEHRPDLAGVIVPDDIFKKNGRDYVPWARIANYLHTTPTAGSATCAALPMAPTSGKHPTALATSCFISRA